MRKICKSATVTKLIMQKYNETANEIFANANGSKTIMKQNKYYDNNSQQQN